MRIHITQDVVEFLTDDGFYSDTPQNLTAHSGGAFSVLPIHIRNFLYRTYGKNNDLVQVFWVNESDPENLQQTAPDTEYIEMALTVAANITTLLENQNNQTEKLYKVDGVKPRDTIELLAGTPFSGNVIYNGVIEQNTQVQIKITFGTAEIIVPLNITQISEPFQILFDEIGVWSIQLLGITDNDNNDYIFFVEVI